MPCVHGSMRPLPGDLIPRSGHHVGFGNPDRRSAAAVEDHLSDAPAGNRGQQVIAAIVAHPMIAARRRTQAALGTIIHYRVTISVVA